jgi:hypothetical protein
MGKWADNSVRQKIMRTTLIFLIFLTIVSCSRQNPETKTISVKTDTLKVSTTFDIKKTISVLKEKDLASDTTVILETRFYFFQPLFRGLFEFYRINYSDSTLCLKEFTLIDPSGAGKDTIYSIKTIKLTNQNFKRIDKLLDKSMFWSLKTLIESTPYFDSDTYIYESVRIEKERKTGNKRHHHFAYSYAPTNKDFINFGQYLRLLAGQKNTYNDKE